ncbi:MAG TPA: adenylate/guanylate cyclase domain-containing protein, partial [Leptospiraceae bacterium]|nr:adenylate/guanylate cyclase domain-containing protein [Leptospiraceae bacterium]
KIKTIGDAYMIVGGLPEPDPHHAENVARFALEMLDVVRQYRQENGLPLELRIGINSGDAVAGVIGKKKFIYDLWGDSVNTASRMESHGLPGQIQVTESTYMLLKDKFQFSERGSMEVKGLGIVKSYLLMEAMEPI